MTRKTVTGHYVVNDPDARTHAAGEPLASQLPSRRLRGPYVRLTRASAPYQPQQSIILAGRREREPMSATLTLGWAGLGWAVIAIQLGGYSPQLQDWVRHRHHARTRSPCLLPYHNLPWAGLSSPSS